MRMEAGDERARITRAEVVECTWVVGVKVGCKVGGQVHGNKMLDCICIIIMKDR